MNKNECDFYLFISYFIHRFDTNHGLAHAERLNAIERKKS